MKDYLCKAKDALYRHRDALLTCIPALVIFLLATYRMPETGKPILFNDEIGYWSNSAFFLGMDWTSVTKNINYYSYGYSLLLMPLQALAGINGWGWAGLYHAAVVMNALFLVMSYGIALKLAGRYLPGMNRVVRTAACFAVCTYSSYTVYAHIAWTECALLFFFWLYLYVMMRVTDSPAVGNHIAFALVSFYLYTIHQRSLGIVAISVLVAVCVRLFRLSRLRDTAAFLGSMYLYGLVHTAVKWNLQHVNYLGEEQAALSEIVGHAFTGTAKLFLIAGLLLFLLLYLIEKRKYKLMLVLLGMGVLLGTGLFWYRTADGTGNTMPAEQTAAADMAADSPAADTRIAVNDFSGQLGVIAHLFSAKGLARLGISMAGKWFYMAAASGLLACWGIWGLFKNTGHLLRDGIGQIKLSYANHANHAEQGGKIPGIEGIRDHIWLSGMFLSWLSTFMVSALYKEGFYKNDDLFNGRYVEFTAGFILLYGFYCLLNDKKWVRTAVLYVLLYMAAGKLCQHLIDDLQRKEFELAHCVMFGRVFWNYEVPYGKVAALTRYVMPLSASFLILLKAARERLPRLAVARTVLALMIPVAAWSYLGKAIVDAYVVVRNEKQEKPFVQFSEWIRILGDGENVYYISDSANDRNPGLLQFMLQEQPVTVVAVTDPTYQEDAFYIMKDYFWETEGVALTDECEIIMRTAGYIMAVNKNQNLAREWDPFRE